MKLYFNYCWIQDLGDDYMGVFWTIVFFSLCLKYSQYKNLSPKKPHKTAATKYNHKSTALAGGTTLSHKADHPADKAGTILLNINLRFERGKWVIHRGHRIVFRYKNYIREGFLPLIHSWNRPKVHCNSAKDIAKLAINSIDYLILKAACKPLNMQS